MKLKKDVKLFIKLLMELKLVLIKKKDKEIKQIIFHDLEDSYDEDKII